MQATRHVGKQTSFVGPWVPPHLARLFAGAHNSMNTNLTRGWDIQTSFTPTASESVKSRLHAPIGVYVQRERDSRESNRHHMYGLGSRHHQQLRRTIGSRFPGTTPEGGFKIFPPAILADSDEPLPPGVADLRGCEGLCWGYDIYSNRLLHLAGPTE